MDENQLILALDALLVSVKESRGISYIDAHEVLAELLECAAEERGAFLIDEEK